MVVLESAKASKIEGRIIAKDQTEKGANANGIKAPNSILNKSNKGKGSLIRKTDNRFLAAVINNLI